MKWPATRLWLEMCLYIQQLSINCLFCRAVFSIYVFLHEAHYTEYAIFFMSFGISVYQKRRLCIGTLSKTISFFRPVSFPMRKVMDIDWSKRSQSTASSAHVKVLHPNLFLVSVSWPNFQKSSDISFSDECRTRISSGWHSHGII